MAKVKQPAPKATKKPEPEPVEASPAPAPSYGTFNPGSTNQNGVEAKALQKTAANLAIPDFMENTILPEVADSGTGYVGFASSASLNWPQMQMAGLKEGQPFCHHNNQYVPVDTLEFFLLLAESFQSLMVGKEGKFQFVTRDMGMVGPTSGSNRTDVHYVSLMLVKVGNELLPIKGDFRGTKSGGVESAIRTVEAAANPDWLAISDAHRLTAAFPKPFGRVWNRVTTTYQVSKTTANPYYRAKCMSSPATVAQMQLLVDSLKDDTFKANLKEAKANFDLRVKFLDDIAVNGPPKVAAPTSAPTGYGPAR